MKTIFIIAKKKYTLKYERKMPEKEVNKMKSFVSKKGEKLVKTSKFKILNTPRRQVPREFRRTETSKTSIECSTTSPRSNSPAWHWPIV